VIFKWVAYLSMSLLKLDHTTIAEIWKYGSLVGLYYNVVGMLTSKNIHVYFNSLPVSINYSFNLFLSQSIVLLSIVLAFLRTGGGPPGVLFY